MYFPLFEPHGWGKRSAAQPQTNCSEFPWVYMNLQLGIELAYRVNRIVRKSPPRDGEGKGGGYLKYLTAAGNIRMSYSPGTLR